MSIDEREREREARMGVMRGVDGVGKAFEAFSPLEKRNAVLKHYQINYISVLPGERATPSCLLRELDTRYPAPASKERT